MNDWNHVVHGRFPAINTVPLSYKPNFMRSVLKLFFEGFVNCGDAQPDVTCVRVCLQIQKMVISGGDYRPDVLKPKEVVSLLLDDNEMEQKCKLLSYWCSY